MKKGTRIFLISLIVILMLAIIAVFTYCTINKYAHAEYADITSDTIVNFNQLARNYYKSNIEISSGNNLLVTKDYSLLADHIFYIKYNFYIPNNRAIEYDIVNTSNDYINVYTASGTNTHDFIFENDSLNCKLTIYTNSSDSRNNIIIIDLTQMFNSNIPNLEQCQNLFNAPYYNYNEGTPMFFGLNENDMMQHLEFRLNSGTITGYPQNVTNTQVSYDSSGVLTLTGVHSDNYAGYFLINMKSSIPVGSIVTINFNSYRKASGISVGLCYANTEERYITSIPTSTADNTPFSFSFVTYEETSGFYLICDNYSSGTIMTIKDATISIQLSSDYQFNLQAQYDLGYNDATTYYTQGYGRQEIWQKGFNEGKAKGLQEANGTFTAMDYVKSAFVTLGDIMNIEVFPNFTLGAFFLLPLITGAIFFIIKISKGG